MFKKKQNNDSGNKNVKIKSNLSSACIQKMISVVGSNQSLNLISAISHKIINRFLFLNFIDLLLHLIFFFFLLFISFSYKIIKEIFKTNI